VQAKSSDKILQQLILQLNPVKHTDIGTVAYETLKNLNSPLTEIQHLFREQGVSIANLNALLLNNLYPKLIDVLIQYLYLTLANDTVKLEEIKRPENHALLALCRYINILLRLIFVDNQLNKNYASKYSMLIQGNVSSSLVKYVLILFRLRYRSKALLRTLN
jgi:hypothetical protein